jgi:hypothetical protein
MRQHDASGNIWATIESISVAEDPDFVRVLSPRRDAPTAGGGGEEAENSGSTVVDESEGPRA